MPSGPRSAGSSPGRPVSWPATTGPVRDTWPKAGRLTAARYQAEEIIRHESGPLTSGEEDDGDQDDEPASAGERPVVIGRGHPSWPEVDAGQRERTGDPGWG